MMSTTRQWRGPGLLTTCSLAWTATATLISEVHLRHGRVRLQVSVKVSGKGKGRGKRKRKRKCKRKGKGKV